MRAEKVRKLLESGVDCLDYERVVGEDERKELMDEYAEALKELKELENDQRA